MKNVVVASLLTFAVVAPLLGFCCYAVGMCTGWVAVQSLVTGAAFGFFAALAEFS